MNSKFCVVRDPMDNARHFRHDPPQEPAVLAERVRVDDLEARRKLPLRPHERDHDMEIGCLLLTRSSTSRSSENISGSLTYL